jgi:hypothetical protein
VDALSFGGGSLQLYYSDQYVWHYSIPKLDKNRIDSIVSKFGSTCKVLNDNIIIDPSECNIEKNCDS